MEPGHPGLDQLDDFVDVVADDQLRLMFLCAHPALAADAQVGLILRLLAGLSTGEIATAFLVPEATMAQRIVRAARTAADGTMVRLAEQDRTRWNRALIREGHELVRGCLRRNEPGPFQIQAAIAAVHADAPTAEATDWSQIVALYDQLSAVQPSPVTALNQSVAIAELHGPAAGLRALAGLDPAALDRYQPYHAARAGLLARAGRRDEAAAAYDRAIELTTNIIERDFLAGQRSAL
jgi:RNA polymerase sigma-70 factor (ECF subfamily)